MAGLLSDNGFDLATCTACAQARLLERDLVAIHFASVHNLMGTTSSGSVVRLVPYQQVLHASDDFAPHPAPIHAN